MDPISAIGLVASIVQLADASFKIVKFLDTIKDGGKERRQLCNEITLLWMTLRNLETHFAPLSEELNGGWMKPMDDLAAKNGVFEQLSETLDDVWNKLTTTDSLRSKVKQTLRWPFDKDYVDRTVGRIERLKTSIIIVEGQASIALAQEMKDDLTVVKQSVVISEFKEIIDWLSPLNFREKQGNITSAPGTGSWFFNSDEFQSWRTGDDRWLWCYGIPGAGKTFIASNTVNELRRNHGSDQALILVAFCSYDTPDTQSIDNLLLSLLKQVVQLRQSLPGNLQRLFMEHSALGTRPKMEEFVKILGDAVAESPKTYIIIDALDEILDDRKRVDLLEALFELKGKPKIMVTSRKIESVANRFGYPLDGIYCDGCQKKRLEVYYHCEDCADYDYCEDCRKDKDAGSHVFVRRFSSVRMRIAAQREDIESYVTRRIEVEEELRQMTERNPKLFTLIINTIVENAQDMFLLARFHMDALADCWNIADVEEALKHLPQEIDETYEIAMSRIEKLSANRRRAVKRLLLWVSHAERPLTMKELEHATAVSRGVREIRKEQIIPSKALTSMSAGLVIIDENERVRLTHKTAEDYFSKKRTTLFQDGDIEIAECCLAYLELAAFDAGPCGGPNESDDFDERLTEHPFIGYAALNWGNHARRCNSEILTPQALLFLRSKHHVESAVQAMWYTDKSSSDSWNVSAGVDALHLAAFFGLIDIVKQLLDDGADADIRDPHGTTPLIYACSQSHLDVANALLDAGAQANVVDERGATALLRSVKNSNYNLTRRIIQEADIAVNALFISFYNYSALILACWNSDAEMVKILLERPDIDVNLASPTTQWNPLLLCADEDEEDCIKLLLQHPSINKDFRDRADYTPIHYAAMSGNIASLEALLKAGADPNSMDDQGGRPLQRAIDYGEFDAVRILLQYKVDWDFTDVLGRTIFHAAAINDQAQILMLLLQTCKDMDIDVQGNGGETALHDAARGGYLTTVRVLLDHGARTDVHNKAGRSPVREAKDAGQTDVLEVLQAAREKEIALEQQRNSHYIRRADTFASQTETSLVPAVLQEDIGTLRVRIARCDPEELNEDTADFKDTALHAACGHRKADIVNMILEAGAFVDPLDVFNRTPLILACQRGDPDIVSALVQHGADVNYNKFNGLAPWEIASTECGYKAAVFLLAQPQTHIDRTSSRINNALGWAAALGDINACKRLVEAGAPLDIKNAEGMTPVQIAKSWDQEEVEKFLFEESLKHRASSSPQLPSIDTLRNQAQSMDKNNTIGHPPRRSPTSKKEFKDLVQPENGPLLTSTSEPLEDVKNALVPDWKAFIALAVLVGVLAVALTLILPLVGIHIG